MMRVLAIKLSDDNLYVYPENVKIVSERNFIWNKSPCISKDRRGSWSGYGALNKRVEEPEWFKPPYMWCHMTDEGKLL